jgi:N-acetyl-anhydromuramyl-L-alanine amidase AmpD
MRPLRFAAAAVAASLLLLAACSDSPETVTQPGACSAAPASAILPAAVPVTSPYDSLFDAAGAEFGVPAGVLRAIGYVETQWQMVTGHEEFPGLASAHGVMALRGTRLAEGARRAGVAEERVRTDARSNIRAAAALLRAYADDAGIARDDESAWAPVVARYSGIDLEVGRERYVREVTAVRAGRRSIPEPGAAAHEVAASCAPKTPVPGPVTDAAGATWYPSPNYNSRMSGIGGVIHVVIVHSCEGSYSGCWSWLASTQSGVSAHYVVREDGAEITQLVWEASRAWHIGANYDSTLNAGHEGQLHGIQSNHFTIGVEHAGYASQTQWPAAQIDASARLVCGIAKRWGIPRDRLHVVSHGQLQPWNRTDPGANWPWAEYMARIEAHCAG